MEVKERTTPYQSLFKEKAVQCLNKHKSAETASIKKHSLLCPRMSRRSQDFITCQVTLQHLLDRTT